MSVTTKSCKFPHCIYDFVILVYLQVMTSSRGLNVELMDMGMTGNDDVDWKVLSFSHVKNALYNLMFLYCC